MFCSTQDGRTALYAACKKGHEEVVKILSSTTTDVNVHTKVSKCPYNAAWKAYYGGKTQPIEGAMTKCGR